MNPSPRVPVPPRVWWREFRTRALLPLMTVAVLFTIARLWPEVISSRPPVNAADVQHVQDSYLVGMKLDGHHNHSKPGNNGLTNLPFTTPLAMSNSPTKLFQ